MKSEKEGEMARWPHGDSSSHWKPGALGTIL